MQRKYALLGGKLGHTLSPPIHTRLFELKGREFEYSLIEAEPDVFLSAMNSVKQLAGCNVTIPHKQAVIPFMDKLDDSAKRYGAVNCIDNKQGVLTGYNTDCDGFLRSVKASGARLDGRVLLLGCGGVGRMMAIESALAGAELYIAVLMSDFPLAQQAVDEITAMKPDADVTIVEINGIDKSLQYDLLINATPVGMYPKCDACPVSDDVIARCGFVFDVIYNPKETLLIKKAASMGKPAVSGMAMLVWQAVSAHEIWDGDSYTDDEVQAIIDEMYEIVQRDFK